jgi:hypothetical protein
MSVARCRFIEARWARTGPGRRWQRRMRQRNRRLAQRSAYWWGVWPKRITYRLNRHGKWARA